MTSNAVLHDFFTRFYAIHEEGRLDGGDICEAGDHFFIGVSRRTNEAGAAQLAEFLDAMGYGATLIDIRSLSNILHLKSGLAYLGGNRLAVIDELQDRKQFSGYDLVEVEPAEAYAANCLVVNDRVLIASGFPRLQDRLEKSRLQNDRPRHVGVSKNGWRAELSVTKILKRGF